MNDPIFFNYFSGDEMLLNDPLEYFFAAGVIPDGIGVNDSDGPLGADSEAVGLSSPDIDESFEAELIGPLFQIGPSFEPFFIGTAFGNALIAAEKDVASPVSDPQIPSSHLEF
jgi:hypothetical protein